MPSRIKFAVNVLSIFDPNILPDKNLVSAGLNTVCMLSLAIWPPDSEFNIN